MQNKYLLLFLVTIVFSCSKSRPYAPMLDGKEVAKLNQLIYKDSIAQWLPRSAANYQLVWKPEAVNGNLAVVFKHKNSEQYCVVVRGSLIEMSKDGLQNWIQDFNVFNLKKWDYTDTLQKAYISRGSYEGFQNLLLLKDKITGDSLSGFLQKLPAEASIVISGHSLGGNLAQVLASYIWKQTAKKRRTQLNVISFGATVVGNNFFVQDLEQKFPNGLRYEIDKDIAPKFPSVDQLAGITEFIGLDSLLGTTGLAGEKNIVSKGLQLLSGIANELKVIPPENNYSQSKKHLQLLQIPLQDSIANAGTLINGIAEKIYHYHKMDQYARLLEGRKVVE